MPRLQTVPYIDATTILTNFRVNGLEPPQGAIPLVEAPPIIMRPAPQAIYGQGIPCKAIGPAWIECGREWIDSPSLDWWMQFFTDSYSQYVSVTVRGFDPLHFGWVTKDAYMWLPIFDPVGKGGYKFRNFRVRFTGIYL